MNFFLPALILTVLSDSSLGFPNGAPPGTCVSLAPKVGPDDNNKTHGDVTAQSGPAPFVLKVGPSSAAPGDYIGITIQPSKDRRDKKFRGFILVVVNANDRELKPFGDFEMFPDSGAKMLKCTTGPGTAATHDSNSHKANMTLMWKVPNDAPKGDYLIRWSMVQETVIFWENIEPVKFKIGDPTSDAATGFYFNTWLSTAAVVLLFALSPWC